MFHLFKRDYSDPRKLISLSLHETMGEALMQVSGFPTFVIVDEDAGAKTLVRTRYGGGLEASTDNGATWQRTAKPGASPVIGLGINRKPLEKGFAANPAARNQDMTMPSLDTVADLARRGAAITARGR